MSQCARMHGVGNSLSNLYLSESKLYNLGSSYISCMFNGKDTNEEVDMQGNATYKNDQWQQSTSLREVSERTNHSSNANGGAAGGVGGAFQEDEMLWWLQYPMEESYERGYCSGMFGELPNTNLLSVRELGYRQNQMGNKIPSVEAEAAMALGAERAAGLASQVGLEAFCRVRTSMQPPVPKWPTSTSSCAYSTAQSFSSSATTPPAIVDASLTPKSGPLNFPQFGVTKQQGDASDHQGDSLITETSTSTESLMNFSAGGGAFPLRISSTKDNPDSVVSSSCERNSHEHSNGYRNSSKRIEIEQPTITSCSGGSAATNEKRKARQVEDWQSEEAECESSDMMKRPPSGRTSTKRSRAAEVHNLSERRRRDRINEKMRALQELIPNSNKTDKASMLDEAIEYLKMLQLQLQMMSMRSGMSIPPMIMPNGMQAQPMQMTQVPYVGNVGMSMGMGMGMGMSMGMGMGMGLGMGVNMGMSMGFVESKPSSSGATGDAMESFPSSSHQIQPYVLEQQPRAATTATATAAAATATTTATAAVAAAAVTTAAATTSQCQF